MFLMTQAMDRIDLWGDSIPGNSHKMKTDVMELGSSHFSNRALDFIKFVLALKWEKGINHKRAIDRFTAHYVWPEDTNCKQSFDDVPYLIPFIAEGSKKAVIVVPGGGYCVKEMENEGTLVAQKLQETGITAFVLWYRCNPYYQPIPLLDMQRAVRVVRGIAERYGYDKDQIGAVGFSAGGAQVSLFLNLLMGETTNFEGHVLDETDSVDDALNFAGLIYPAVTYNHNPGMRYASFPAEEVRNADRKAQLMAQYNVLEHFHAQGIPHFVSYGTKDTMVSIEEIKDYIERLQNSDTPYKLVTVEGAGHGYGASDKRYRFWLDELTAWINKL